LRSDYCRSYTKDKLDTKSFHLYNCLSSKLCCR
jgi:hypothetical protein